MFGNGNFSFTMENTIIDSNLNSLCIELSNQEKTYKGAIKSLEFSLSNVEAVKYELIEIK